MFKSTDRDSEKTFIALNSPSNLSFSSPSPIQHKKSYFEALQNKVLEDAPDDDIEIIIEDNTAHDYFKQDPEEEVEDDEEALKQKLSNQKEGNSYESGFKTKVFFKFFIIHILFYCCLGPFIVVLTPIFGWPLLRNQFLTPTCSLIYLRQCIEFSIIVAFLFVFYSTNTPGLQAIEIYMLLVCVIVRIILISSKYACQNDLVIKLMHTTILTAKDRFHDMMLTDWRLQNDLIIGEEIRAAILRLEIDSPLFFFNFLGKISDELRNKLSRRINESKFSDFGYDEINRKLENLPRFKSVMKEPNEASTEKKNDINHRWYQNLATKLRSKLKKKNNNNEKQKEKDKNVKKDIERGKEGKPTFSTSSTAATEWFMTNFMRPQKLESKYLHGYNLVLDLIKNARVVKYKTIGRICLFFSLIRAFLPTFYRIYLIQYKNKDISLLTEKPYIVIVVFVLNCYLFWVNTFILSIAVQDFTTKVWCFKQIGYLISPKKIREFKTRKLYPTLNIFDPVTLKTWSSLRKVIKEYGRKYAIRNSFNVTICMAVYAFVLCTFVLQMLGVFTAYSDPLMLIVFGYESIVFLVIFISVLTGAAFLNNQYRVHKNLLKKNKTIISDFAKLSHLYVGKDAIKPDNIIYKQGLKVLRKELGEEDFEKKLVVRAEKLLDMIDETIEELDFEEVNEPFTVLGIKIDDNFLKSTAIGVASLLFALGQSLINK